uniref:Uncharacterized protein n=1 Tax=Arundo donax TaxID=35708 RepID=A0A0A9BFR5_ARUDO
MLFYHFLQFFLLLARSLFVYLWAPMMSD